jgi:hypothetical protein
VDRLLDDLTGAYDRGIQVPGREAHFLVLLAFLCSFGFIRTSAHMIRAQVSWWPGNVETKSGTHIHHMVWGILLLMTMGYLGIAVAPDSPWRELIAVAFGIGLGLTLDEFALWLNLEDVYWQEKGRESIDAVIVAATLLTLTLLGLSFWIDVYEAVLRPLGWRDQSTPILIAIQLAAVGFAVVCWRRGRVLVGIAGIFVPLLGILGAIWPERSSS